MDRIHPSLILLGGLLLATGYGVVCYYIFYEDELSLSIISLSFFTLIPYGIGMISVNSVKDAKYQTLLYAIFIPWSACLIVFLVLVIFTVGIFFCIIVGMPIFLPASSLGGVAMWLVKRNRRLATFLLSVAILAPYFASPVEAQFDTPRQVTVTYTSIVIDASASTIWEQITSVELITPEEHRFNWLHFVGLPRPVSASMDVDGIGGVREATWENGLHFDEKIIEWEKDRRIHFTIKESSLVTLPPPLDLIDGEHFDVVAGMYELEELADGTVRLHFTSEHYLDTPFNDYGSLWTNYVMRDLQDYILEIIKVRAES